MCIRDRFVGLANIDIKLALIMAVSVPIALAFLYMTIKLVSYTHLDVYKRQGEGLRRLVSSVRAFSA